MTRGLIDRDSFLKLSPAAQENLLRQALLLCLTALELANRNPDDWESAAFAQAIDRLTAKSLPEAYDAVERMLLPVAQRPNQPRMVRKATDIMLVDGENGGSRLVTPDPSAEKLDRKGMRRRLLQLSAVELPVLDRADARRSVVARARRRYARAREGEEAGS